VKAHLEVELPFDIQWAGILEHYSEAPLNVNAARDINGDGLLNDWVNEEICRTVSCPGFNYSRNSVRELSTEDANRLRSLLGLAPIAQFANNPKYLNLNMSLQKSVRFGGRRARAKMEVLNVFNTPQRLIGSASATSAIFGTLRGRRPAARRPTDLPIRLVIAGNWVNSQLPTTNSQPLPTPKSQPDTDLLRSNRRWKLGIGSGWALGVRALGVSMKRSSSGWHLSVFRVEA
jgi:hypothetical protein